MRPETESSQAEAHSLQVAVIWINGFHDPDTIRRAKADAMSRNCSQQIVKNSVMYRNANTRQVEAARYCYTNEPHIARDHEQAGIQVIDLDTLPDMDSAADEITRLQAELDAATRAAEERPRRGRPPGSKNKTETDDVTATTETEGGAA